MTGMNRRAEFFALEATEYLAELAPIAARADMPDPERLVRGARALRGAALMAGLGTFARAAAALEAVARQVRDHALGWEPHARAGWREGLDTLRGLVARATTWEAADDQQSLALAERLERIAAGQVAAPVAPVAAPEPVGAPTGLSPGVRAFIARESALIAGSLLEASRALAPLPPHDALAGVLERMRSLRGIGAAGELSPLPELLDAMEMTTRSLLGESPPPPDVASVFADAADALSAMARSVSEHGRVIVPAGLDTVGPRLLASFASEHDVVPIEGLAPGDQPAVLQRGTPPAAAAAGDPIPLELVGVGDHLVQHAEALERNASPIARDLRLFVLHRTLASMPVRSGTGHFLAPLASAISATIGSGRAADAPEQFPELLREAGRFLVEAGEHGNTGALLERRDRLAARIDPARRPAVPPPLPPARGDAETDDLAGTPIIAIEALAPAPEPVEEVLLEVTVEETVIDITLLQPDEDIDEPIVDIASLAPEAGVVDPIVDIASLAPDDAAPEPIVEIASLAPDDVASVPPVVTRDIPATAPGEPGRLERAFVALRRLEQGGNREAPSLEALVGAATPIDGLLYRGDRALARAEEVRAELAGILAEPTVSLERLRPLLDELLDLVPLARDAA